MEYILELYQQPCGDIGLCGGSLTIPFDAHDMDHAIIIARDKIEEGYSHEESQAEFGRVFEVSKRVELDMPGIFRKINEQTKIREKEAYRQREIETLNRLKQKYPGQ